MSNAIALDIEIRPAIAADADALAALMAEMDDAPTESLDDVRMRAVLADMAHYPNFCAWLVLERGVPVASFSLLIFSSPSHQGTHQALLDAVVVTRARRGAGIGEAMIERALAIATEAGCYKMMLSSNLKRIDAHRFYERIGFSQHGISFGIDLPLAH
jgi:GNAT superfamily N-acetyltransferase